MWIADQLHSSHSLAASPSSRFDQLDAPRTGVPIVHERETAAIDRDSDLRDRRGRIFSAAPQR